MWKAICRIILDLFLVYVLAVLVLKPLVLSVFGLDLIGFCSIWVWKERAAGLPLETWLPRCRGLKLLERILRSKRELPSYKICIRIRMMKSITNSSLKYVVFIFFISLFCSSLFIFDRYRASVRWCSCSIYLNFFSAENVERKKTEVRMYYLMIFFNEHDRFIWNCKLMQVLEPEVLVRKIHRHFSRLQKAHKLCRFS